MRLFKVSFVETNESFFCSDQETLLEGMERLGKKGIPVGCKGGGCGVCKVEILEGSYCKGFMSREHISIAEENKGSVLACKVVPKGNISLRVLGLMKKNIFSVK